MILLVHLWYRAINISLYGFYTNGVSALSFAAKKTISTFKSVARTLNIQQIMWQSGTEQRGKNPTQKTIDKRLKNMHEVKTEWGGQKI